MTDHIGTTSGEFSVCQYFPDDTHEYVRRWVSDKEAVEAFFHYITSVGAKLGTTVRVMITDGDDYCNADWKWAEGVVFMGQPDHPILGHFKEGHDDRSN